ncbi:MAG: hypothetical protein FRX49_04329 [Trebouxia sp. A1-2]|nr:MAG: hypothetical protein FRX49_04329 [Trebouxia sp. A1-2]
MADLRRQVRHRLANVIHQSLDLGIQDGTLLSLSPPIRALEEQVILHVTSYHNGVEFITSPDLGRLARCKLPILLLQLLHQMGGGLDGGGHGMLQGRLAQCEYLLIPLIQSPCQGNHDVSLLQQQLLIPVHLHTNSDV